jgi:hypothetical protein
MLESSILTMGSRGQVNITLSDSESDLLDAVAYVEAVKPATLLRPVIERYLADQSNRAEVRAALQARVLARQGPAAAEPSAEIVPIRSDRSQRNGHSTPNLNT